MPRQCAEFIAAGRGAFAIAMILGCAASSPPRTEATAPALRGLDFGADLEVVERLPVQLVATVTIENRRSTPAVLTFPSPCVGLLRAYEGDGSRRAPVWEQAPGAECPPAPYSLGLMPGDEREIRIPTVNASEVLSLNLPDGTYRFTVVLEPDGYVLEIDAGSAELERALDPGDG